MIHESLSRELIGAIRQVRTVCHVWQPTGAMLSASNDRRLQCERSGPAAESVHAADVKLRRMVEDDEKLALDTQRLQVYLTSIQAEVEAKVRALHQFRQQMQHLDRGASRSTVQRKAAGHALIR